MRRVYRCCAGLDVHQKSVAACIRVSKNRRVELVKAVFGTFSEDLKALADWLKVYKIRHVAMESTGVYWIPVWNVLERAKRFDLVLVNPQHARAIPGKKTDQIDCERLAELHQYGLVRPSFIPPAPIRELRDLTRRRTHLQQDRNRVINRIRRLLETANIKLGSVMSNVVGDTGRSILEGLATTKLNRPEIFADFAKGSLKQKKEEIRKALRVPITEHFQFMLSELLDELDRLDKKVDAMEARIRQKMIPYEAHIVRLCTVPGIQRITAWTIIAEIGVDMTKFPTPEQLASWAGLCPGNSQSAGKRKSAKTRKGDRYLRRILTQTAWAIARRKDGGFLTTMFFRIARHAGMKKAAVAIAHRVLTTIHRMFSRGLDYVDPGANYLDRLHPQRTTKRLVQRLEQLGLDVVVRPRSTA
jgi:transposase